MPRILTTGSRVGRGPRAAITIVGAIALAGVLLVAFGGIGLMTVTSPSMAPTHEQGSHLLTTPFGARDVERGDVVVFRTPREWADAAARAEGLDAAVAGHMVKRIVGMPGDTVECCTSDGVLVVNGAPVEEPYLREPASTANNPSFRVTVPVDTVWVMGDNRRHSFDSRAMHARGDGFLPISAITGRPLLRLP